HDQPHGDQHGGEGDRDPGGGEHRPDHHQRESDQQGVAQGAHDAREDVRALDVPARDGVVRGGLATQLLAGGAGALSGAGPAVRVALAGSVAAGVVPAVVGRGTLADVGRRVLAGPLAPRLPALVALVGSGRRARLVLAPALVDRAAGGAHIAAGTVTGPPGGVLRGRGLLAGGVPRRLLVGRPVGHGTPRLSGVSRR